MSRLKKTLEARSKNILNVYCTAGYPTLDSTVEIMKALQHNGANIIELGMPFSDPLADGPVIQQSSAIALANGMTIKVLFEQLTGFRQHISIPVVLMGYMNSVLQFGFEKFCAAAAAVGIDGLIIPDLPEYEFETVYGEVIKKYNLDFIFLVTPETADDRIKKLDRLSSGFLYAVSSSSTTGGENSNTVSTQYLQKLNSLGLHNPVLVGFGIKDKASFNAVCQLASGGIIGSAYIKALENSVDVQATTQTFLTSIIANR
jgi:tryptophan synthase alpha chain